MAGAVSCGGQPKSSQGEGWRGDNDCGVTGDERQYQSFSSTCSGASPWGLDAFYQCAAACTEVGLHFSATADPLAAERVVL